MRGFQALSISRKLMLIIMVTSSAALLLACVLLVAYEVYVSHQTMPRTLAALAEMIGVNSKAALTYNNPKAAQDTLESLRAQSEIVRACTYTPEGTVVAKYPRGDGPDSFIPLPAESDGYRFGNDRLVLFHRIIDLDKDWIGTIYLESDLGMMYQRIQRYTLIAATVLVASSLLAFVLSANLRRVISEPILRLAQTANAVAQEKNYSVRVPKQSQDELGQLIDGFNEMLSQIQARDAALQEAHDKLERRVAERTAELSQANQLLKQEIRERQQAEEAQQNLEVQLRQSQKMEAIGQLAAGVAHDFNNIMTIIQGYTSLVLSTTQVSQDVEESLRQVSAAADRAANLTRQLLTFSRKQVMQLRSLDLNDVVRRVTGMLGRFLGEHISLECLYAPRLPRVQADAGMMEQLITNLAVNARDAMPKGGRLIISTLAREIEAAYVKQNSEARPGQFVCLTMTDTGSGMGATVLAKLFEPFYTTKDVGKGTGLGLATVYGIVKQHQGWIEVTSEVGIGSTFRVFVPAMAEETSQEPVDDDQSLRGLEGTETILLVEDEPALRRLARRVLERYGYTVLEAETGVEALTVWRRHSREIDLLLADIVMPEGIGGRELAEHMRKEKNDLSVIYSSGYSLDITGRSSASRGGAVVLPKPYQPAALVRAVRGCLDRGRR